MTEGMQTGTVIAGIPTSLSAKLSVLVDPLEKYTVAGWTSDLTWQSHFIRS